MKISLKAARVNANMTQQQAGAVINASKDVIKAIEKGTREIRISEFEMLCDAYKCNRDDIFLPYHIAKNDMKKGK